LSALFILEIENRLISSHISLVKSYIKLFIATERYVMVHLR